jgi:O-acetyl-ADP-ribose deacetylase (regulator of RNase III)
MKVEVIRGDLLDQQVDVIVNAWNRNIIPYWLLLPQGVSGAIKKRAGVKPFREVSKHGNILLGQAVLTSAGKLSYKGIIHVAGINAFWFASEFSIRHSVSSAMLLLQSHSFESVAFPVIGAGSGSFGKTKALKIMLEEFAQIESKVQVKIVEYDR